MTSQYPPVGVPYGRPEIVERWRIPPTPQSPSRGRRRRRGRKATSHEEAVGLVGVGRNAIINSVLLVLSPAVGPDRVGAGTERIEASALGRAGEGIETGTGTGLIPLFALCRAVVAITHEEAGLIGVRGDVHVRSELLLAAPAAAAAAEGIEASARE
eukprot:scaffold2481_cov145-Skeletonema_menzelii.AAC.5